MTIIHSNTAIKENLGNQKLLQIRQNAIDLPAFDIETQLKVYMCLSDVTLAVHCILR